MESSPRTISTIVNDFEQRLRHLHTTRVHDEQTLNALESLLNDCSEHLNRLIPSADPTLVALLLPTLLHTIISLSKGCAEKSDLIISGTFLSREKLTSLITNTKSTHNQIKEFVKSPKLLTILTKSIHQRQFCAQLRQVSDSIANIDILTTLICHKLIVKLLTGSDDQQTISDVRMEDANDGLILAVYNSVLRQLNTICSRNSREKNDSNRESPYNKMYGIYFQMLSKLLQYNDTISQIESHTECIRLMLQLHLCLESTCQQNRFQVEFFNNTILLQDVLQCLLAHPSKLFLEDLFEEITVQQNKYASLILLFRLIEVYDYQLNQQSLQTHLLISHLFDLIDECRIPLVLPALLPVSFGKTQVDYGSLYDITYSLLMKLFHQQSMQTLLSAMNKLIQSTDFSTSVQLASELIIQAWYLSHSSSQVQHLFGLFLCELLRSDIHSSLISHLFTLPHIRSVKFRAYDALISSDVSHRIYDFLTTTTTTTKEPLINLTSLPLLFPATIDLLYPFVRLFQTELTSQQLQHTIDTCIYSIQQFLALPLITDLTCRHFLLTLRLLTYLIVKDNHETFKCLLGQLTQIFIVLDEQTAIDVRLELIRVFAMHSNLLEDNDLGRLLDFILTSSLESTPTSIAFHIACLDLVDSLKQRPSRSVNITDLVIQLIVRYGNEHQCSHILKAHLMRTFLGYISNGNDDSLPVRVKSQCVLLRANIDEFEKSKKTIGTTNIYLTDEHVLKALDSTRSSMTTDKDSIINDQDTQLKFYRTIVEELEYQQSSLARQTSNAMQQD